MGHNFDDVFPQQAIQGELLLPIKIVVHDLIRSDSSLRCWVLLNLLELIIRKKADSPTP